MQKRRSNCETIGSNCYEFFREKNHMKKKKKKKKKKTN